MTVEALLIPVGDDVYALEVAAVREVITEPATTSVPTAPAAMLGVFNLRGEVVPLFDPAALLGIGRVTDATNVVVVTTSVGPAGLVLSGLPKVVVLEEHVGPSELRATRGIYVYPDGVAVLLDAEELVVSAGAIMPADLHGPMR